MDGFQQNTGFRTLLCGPYVRMQMPIPDLPEKGTFHLDLKIHNIIDKVTEAVFFINGKELLDDVIDSSYVKEGINLSIPIEEMDLDEKKTVTLEIKLPEIDEAEMEVPEEERTRTFSLVSFVADVK